MEDKNLDKQFQATGNNSNNIIFGTSSDDIERGLHNGQFVDTAAEGIDEKDQVVNDEEQNEIVNPSEENFNEELAPRSGSTDNTSSSEKPATSATLEENVVDLDPDKDTIDNAGKISKVED